MPRLAQHLFELLHAQGVQHAFGLPGDFALPLFDALSKSPLQLVTLTHEPSVGFAADAYSRIRGLGVAVVTYGVGALNMVNPIAQAYAEKSPLIVVSGGPGVEERKSREMLHHRVKSYESQICIYQEVTAYATILDDPLTADLKIHRALEVAITYKRPVYLEVPRDMVDAEIPERPRTPLVLKSSDPDALKEALEETVTMINDAERVVLMVGVEVHRFGVQFEVMELAERLGVPVCATMLGKSAFPENHPQYIGVYNGEVGDPYVKEVVEKADCLLLLGVLLTDVNLGMFTARLDPKRMILATSEGITVRHHHYATVNFTDFIHHLCTEPLLERPPTPAIVPMRPRVAPSQGLLTMGGLLYELNAFLNEATLLVTDTGDPLFAATDIKTCEGTSFLSPAFYASMGFGVPAVIGAMLADPFRRGIALVGDGAFLMTGMELVTAKQLGLNPIVIVINNEGYASLRVMGRQDANYLNRFPKVSYIKLAEVLGGVGIYAETGDQFRQALWKAKECSEFCVIEVRLSPNDVSPALRRLGELFAHPLRV